MFGGEIAGGKNMTSVQGKKPGTVYSASTAVQEIRFSRFGDLISREKNDKIQYFFWCGTLSRKPSESDVGDQT